MIKLGAALAIIWIFGTALTFVALGFAALDGQSVLLALVPLTIATSAAIALALISANEG